MSRAEMTDHAVPGRGRRIVRALCTRCGAGVTVPQGASVRDYYCPHPCGGFLSPRKGPSHGLVIKQGAKQYAPVDHAVLRAMAPPLDAPAPPPQAGTARVTDCGIDVWYEDVNDAVSEAMLRHGLAVLQARGWSVMVDPNAAANHAGIARNHFVGACRTPAGPLEMAAQCMGRHVEFKFFQPDRAENPNGARYDFRPSQRMDPMPLRRALCDIAALGRACAAVDLAGAPTTPMAVRRALARWGNDTADATTPLEWFNARWNKGEPPGRQRFERGPDGWPVEREYAGSCCPYLDRDGAPIVHGGVYCARATYGDGKGYLMIGTAWKDLGNSMLLWVNGTPHHVQMRDLFRCDAPALLPRRFVGGQRERLAKMLDDATRAKAWKRVAVLAGVLDRMGAGAP